MTAKRALVVDDSKSARSFLAKLLEDQRLEVDAAETAEQAIEYLSRNRPDVIFMDHLMPGMDGFQAVQAIKGNPRTATIPILMYTSQEGELYLGQARALGAVGVLPKSVEPADVRTVLRQLHLTNDEDTATVAAQPDLLHAAVAAVAAADSVRVPLPAFDNHAGELIRDEVANLRHYLADSFDTHTDRVLKELRSVVKEEIPAAPEAVAPPPATPSNLVPWLLATAASIAAAIFGAWHWQGQQRNDELRRELADTKATVAEITARIQVSPRLSLGATLQPVDSEGDVASITIPFGEAPYAGARIQQMQEFIERVAAARKPGKVQLQRFTGRFCLTGSGAEGYGLAQAATPYVECNLVADATDPAVAPGAPESVQFANTLAELRKKHAALLTIEVGEGRVEDMKAPYPEIGGTPPRIPTAAEWNEAAAANNRVEMRWLPTT
jgi:CheY-like chemotaxis protein